MPHPRFRGRQSATINVGKESTWPWLSVMDTDRDVEIEGLMENALGITLVGQCEKQG